MNRKSFTFLASILLCLGSIAQQQAETSIASLKGEMFRAKKSNKQVDEWLLQSIGFIERKGEKKSDIDSATELAKKAMDWSRSLSYTKGFNESLYALSWAQVEKGDSRTAHRLLEQANDTTKVKILTMLEDYHFAGGQITRSNDSALYCVEKALTYLVPGKYPVMESEIRESIIYYSVQKGDDSRVQEQYLQIMQLKGKIPIEEIVKFHHTVSIFYYEKGNYSQSLRYALKGLELSEQNKRFMAERMYSILGSIYRQQGQLEKCIEAHSNAMAINKANKKLDRVWIACDYMSTCYSLLKRFDEGFKQLYALEKEVGFSSPMDRVFYYRSLGKLFLESGNIAESDKAYIALDSLVEDKKIKDRNTFDFLCKFYFRKKNYLRSRYYLDKALRIPNIGDLSRMSLYMTQFSLDTVSGNYQSAIQTLLALHKVQDTLRSSERDKNLKSLLVQYEAEKKRQEPSAPKAENRVIITWKPAKG